jgi:hypothetical protein
MIATAVRGLLAASSLAVLGALAGPAAAFPTHPAVTQTATAHSAPRFVLRPWVARHYAPTLRAGVLRRLAANPAHAAALAARVPRQPQGGENLAARNAFFPYGSYLKGPHPFAGLGMR